MYFRFIQTKPLLCHLQIAPPRPPLLSQIQPMPPPRQAAVPCSQRPVSLWFQSLFYICTVRDSDQEASLLPHLPNPAQTATTSPVWRRRNLIPHRYLIDAENVENSKFDSFQGRVKGLTDDGCQY